MSTTITIQPFERAYCLSLINFLHTVLPNFGIHEIDVMYGLAWGNEIFNWKTRSIELSSLLNEISDIESQGFGNLGEDELHIIIKSHNLKIVLCHETDIHVEFDIATPLLEQMLNFLSSSFQTITQETEPYTSPIFFSDKPTFSVSSILSAEKLESSIINLVQWNKILELPPCKLIRIMGYDSSQSGLLEIDQSNEIIKVKGWHSSNIRVYCDKYLLYDTKELSKEGRV
ncbi:MAG TPA: hypothetical protein PLT08_05205 [Anaerolineales bacterium]|nr:hypothetical protein [Anaerolineales bacterium]